MRLVDSQVILDLPPAPMAEADKDVQIDEIREWAHDAREVLVRWAEEVDTQFALMKREIVPKMTTTERNALEKVVAGVVIYNTTTNKLNFWNGAAWEVVTSV
jgi:hypothetical protein